MSCSFVAPSASVIGNVKIGEHSSVWYNAVIRGDVNAIKIGDAVSVGENALIHCSGVESFNTPTNIGNRVLIGAGANIHGCTLEDECQIGDMATVLDKAVVKRHAIVSPGSVVAAGTVVPSRQLWSGIPAKYERDLTSNEINRIAYEISNSAEMASMHAEETSKGWEQVIDEADEREENRARNSHYYQPISEEVKAGLEGDTEGHAVPGRIFDSDVSARKADSKFHGFFESQQKDLEYVQREVEKKKEQRNNL
eukprot:CAMPEP_0116956942 /NCGR_PEP_ID=MMETSP0467-20121206/43653_1 /TAXON_ID=283647 /ORGANISM="Mesodinium pulex, Strain SPMC105" /LENGTH=252 /DNA_ID=CAMNT_0004643551 /DNA_START=89 /DNA_END=847 /DNA_ORIENTATION=+